MKIQSSLGVVAVAVFFSVWTAARGQSSSRALSKEQAGHIAKESEMAEDLEVMGKIVHSTIRVLYGEEDNLTWWTHHKKTWPQLVEESAKSSIAAPLANHLDSYGVVFQMELPGVRPVTTDASDDEPKSKTTTLWDQVRGRLRGEAATKNVDAQLAKSCLQCHEVASVPVLGKIPLLNRLFNRQDGRWNVPTQEELTDALLDVLAENGHNFRHLAADERLAIALTIQPWMHPDVELGKLDAAGLQRWRGHGDSVNSDLAAASGWVDLGHPLVNPLNEFDAQLGFGLQLTLPIGSGIDNVNNHELTGDLHARQGRLEEAIHAYEKAMEMSFADVQQSRDEKGVDPGKSDAHNQSVLRVYQKLAATYDHAGQTDEAKKYRDWITQLQFLYGQKAPADAMRRYYIDVYGILPPAAVRDRKAYPARLTVSATKSLLDQVAAGDVTPQQFRSLAAVRYTGGNPRPLADEKTGESDKRRR